MLKSYQSSSPRDDGDDVAEANDQKSFDQPSLTNDPGETQEQHHAPDVQEAAHEDTLEPGTDVANTFLSWATQLC